MLGLVNNRKEIEKARKNWQLEKGMKRNIFIKVLPKRKEAAD